MGDFTGLTKLLEKSSRSEHKGKAHEDNLMSRLLHRRKALLASDGLTGRNKVPEDIPTKKQPNGTGGQVNGKISRPTKTGNSKLQLRRWSRKSKASVDNQAPSEDLDLEKGPGDPPVKQAW